MKKNNILKICGMLIASFILVGIWAPTTSHATDQFVDPSIVNQTISKWNILESYEQGSLVMYNDRVYYANAELKGSIPSADINWICKADFSDLDESNSNNFHLSDNSQLSRLSIRIIDMNANISKNQYNYTIRPLRAGIWNAQVNSLIHYDNGSKFIVKNDYYSCASLTNLPFQSQGRKYWYSGMTRVTIILSGTYNGKALESSGAVVYPR